MSLSCRGGQGEGLQGTRRKGLRVLKRVLLQRREGEIGDGGGGPGLREVTRVDAEDHRRHRR